MVCQCSSKKFVELGNYRIVDCGHNKGYDIMRWISDKGNEDIGEWKNIYHAPTPKRAISYLHKLDNEKEKKDGAAKKNSGSKKNG